MAQDHLSGTLARGFMAGPNGELDWHVVGDDFASCVAAMENEIDTILFGRVTYEMMAAHWPASTQSVAKEAA